MYAELKEPISSNNTVTHATISVLPKSSLVGTTIFFEAYARLLKDKKAKLDLTFPQEPKQVIGDVKFEISHFLCPNFLEVVNEVMLANWQRLVLDEDCNRGIGCGLSSQVPSELLLSKQHRLVFIYRNPLDQILSYYKFERMLPADHVLPQADFNRDDFVRFVFTKGLPAYIRMFYTFHVVGQVYPDNILFIPYEILVLERETTLQSILKFLNMPYDAQAFTRAEQATNFTSLKQYEERHGTIFGPYKHIRNGGIGVWQQYLTVDEVLCIEDALKKFGLSLGYFKLALALQPNFHFLEEQNMSKRAYMRV